MGGYELLLLVGVLLVLLTGKRFFLSLRELRRESEDLRSFFGWLAAILALVIVTALAYSLQHAR
jgi:hypothetical protein